MLLNHETKATDETLIGTNTLGQNRLQSNGNEYYPHIRVEDKYLSFVVSSYHAKHQISRIVQRQFFKRSTLL